MKRPALVVLVLALLIALAFLRHRQAREPDPRGLQARAAIVDGAPTGDAGAASLVVAPAPAPALPGTIRGVVRINGPVPARKSYSTDDDPDCAAMHGKKIVSDELVVDPYGNMQWAFVYIKSGLTGAVPPAPRTPVLLDQVSCVFTPHVSGVRVGQPLVVLNSDSLLHTVHALPFGNKEFNLNMPKGSREITRTFGQPEVMIKIVCDLHPWMSAWIGVLDHPYFGVTNAVGSYVIRDVPPGNYEVEAWHEKCGPRKLPIAVAPGRESLLDFALDEKTK